jgi:hypothetical protein
MADWYFKPLQPGGKISEPIHGEFFSTDAISNPGTALIREGIQNSLDQSVSNEPVLVRIFLSGKKEAVSYTEVGDYFKNVYNHYRAEDSGLHLDEIPNEDSSCNFIVFEDFSTTGLEGDPGQAFKSKEGGKNNFYHFFRAEGQTDKDEVELGSWGVGKFVFFRSGSLSTVFGLTVRSSDNKRMLMGKTILKSHWLNDEYCQDGYFGIPPDEEHEIVMPTTDKKILDKFSETFKLQRGNNDSGLSLVVPWPDAEIDEKTIITAVLKDYFYPILLDQLEVMVETPSIKTWLDNNNLLEEMSKLDKEIISELRPLIKLTDWARKINNEERFLISEPDPSQAWKWSKTLLAEEQLGKMKELYFSGKKLAVRVPVTVREKSGENSDSFFDVYLVRDNNEQFGYPVFIRDGIIISKVDSPRTRGVRSVVIAHDEPVSRFLRKAENPSHTEWQHYHMKEDYERGYKTDLDFVKRCVHELVRFITEAEKEEDPTLLIDFFSLAKGLVEEEPVETQEANDGDEDGNEPIPPNPDPPLSKPKSFRIQKIDGGFSILPGSSDNHPSSLKIQVAYDTRRGNPLKKYNEADFELNRDPILLKPDSRNIEIIKSYGNQMIININDDDFEFHITGFDKRRQLYIKANPFAGNTDGSS